MAAMQIQQGTTDTLSAIVGTVANVIVPGSGAIAAGAVRAGAQIFNSVASAFDGAKKKGKTDAEATAIAAATQPTAAEKAEFQKLLKLDAAYTRYLQNLTPEDTKLSTIFKSSKMSGKDIPYMELTRQAIAQGKINGDLLGVYKGFATGDISQVITTTGGTLQPGASSAGAAQKPGTNLPPLGGEGVAFEVDGQTVEVTATRATKPKSGGGMFLGVLAFASAIAANYVNFVLARAADEAAARRKKSTAKARRAKKEKAAAADEKAAAQAKRLANLAAARRRKNNVSA